MLIVTIKPQERTHKIKNKKIIALSKREKVIKKIKNNNIYNQVIIKNNNKLELTLLFKIMNNQSLR